MSLLFWPLLLVELDLSKQHMFPIALTRFEIAFAFEAQCGQRLTGFSMQEFNEAFY